jgi:hypothetical protein
MQISLRGCSGCPHVPRRAPAVVAVEWIRPGREQVGERYDQSVDADSRDPSRIDLVPGFESHQ